MAKKDPAPSLSVGARVRNFLGWAFVISIALHWLVLPLVIRYNPSHAEQPETEKVSVTKKVKVVVPTPPPPTPTPPPPTPPPHNTPPPVKATNPPPQAHLKVNVVHTTSKAASGPSESRYNVTKGSESGVPHGTVSSAAPAPAAPSAKPATPAPPPPTPSPTPRPQCAVPNKEATLVNGATADTPEMAKEQGISGVVEVEVDLDATGHLTNASVIKTPSSMLNSAALSAARQSSYSPKLEDCKPVPGQYKFEVDFSAQ
ncbi:MAG: TonB family protein [Candidatus Eremiobacteraeota bacterium]|nr:TonB family protein [Candidatus Eremiobacteraeota bacterium]